MVLRPAVPLAAVLSAALPMVGSVAFARARQQQPEPIILSSVECGDCGIGLERAARLGEDSGPGRIERTDVLVQRGNGDYVLHVSFDPGFMHVFNSDGTFRERVGRQGQGPGEFLTIQEIIAFGRDELIAFDYQNQRGNIVDGSGMTVGTVPLRGVVPRQTGVVAFPRDSLLVINRHLRTPDKVGNPLHLVDFNGHVLRSFGSSRNVEVDLDEQTYRRRLAGSPDGAVWAGSLGHYVLDQWSHDGVHLKSYRRQADWFVTQDPHVPLSPEGGRFSEVMDIDVDAQAEQLWVLVQVPGTNDDWADGLISEEYGGRREYGPGDYSKIYDTMVEVIDVRTDRLIASERVGPALRRFVGRGLVSSFGIDTSTGVEYMDVWRVRLVQPDH